MTDAQLQAALRAALRRSTASTFLLGVGIFLLGLLALACGLFRWDPEMNSYGPGMWAGYAGVVCLFCATGMGMVVAAVLILPRKAEDFIDRVIRRPHTIKRLWLHLVKHKYNPNNKTGQLGVDTSLCAETTDNRHFQFVVHGPNAEALMMAIAARNTDVLLGPP
jgi:hypothetical protein